MVKYANETIKLYGLPERGKMYYSSVALLALLVHIIIHFDVIINRHYRRETPAAKAYRALIISMMGFYIFDAFWGILYDARLIQAVVSTQ